MPNIESIASTEIELESSQGRRQEVVATSQSNVFVRSIDDVVTQQAHQS